MRKLLYVACLVAALSACSNGTSEQAAAEAAKSYYDQLREGYYEGFLEGKAGIDSLPADYCEQLLDVCRHYMDDLVRKHQGRIFKVLETAKQVYLNRKIKIGTSKLNEVMLPIIEATPPPSIKGKYIKIKYVSQVPDTQIPTFVFYANLPQYVKEPYRRFLENKMRENWTLTGTPINVFIRQK